MHRLYYSIGEVCERLNVKAHTLRYWEEEFTQLRPRKNSSGHRSYTDADFQLVQRIQELLKVEKFTIEGARQVLDQEGGVAKMEPQRQELLQLRAFLENIRDRIA